MRFGHLIPFVLVFCHTFPRHLEAASPVEEVQSALDSMHAWVGQNDNGRAWRRFLKSDTLSAEIGKGEAADVSQLRAILAIYEGDTPGLDSANFVTVRRALSKWTSTLEAAESLLDRLRGAKGKSRQLQDADVAVAKERLLADITELDRFLASGPSDNAESWKRFLQWSTMQEELAKADGPSLGILNRSLVKFRENETGLELPVFTTVRSSLRAYMNRVKFSKNADFAQQYDERIDRLVALLEEYAENPTSADGLQIGRTLGWFEQAEQIPSIVASVRGAHSHANLLVSASQRLAAAGIEDTVDRTQGVQDNILGTSIHGTARLQGTVGLELIPSAEQAAFDILLRGTAVSNNVGTNRSVKIYTTGYTNVTARKRIYVADDGMTSTAAKGWASTSSNINCISAPLPIIRKIAWKRAQGSKGQAERIASGKAAVRVAGQVDAQAATMIAESNENFDTKVRYPLIRRNSLPTLNLSTTAEHFVVRMLHATSLQIAAPTAPPVFDGEYDLKARAHESVVGNMSESLVGGVMLTDQRIAELYKEAEREVPEEVLKDDPWAITFSRSQPIGVAFSADGVEVTVRCRSLHRGDGYARVNLTNVAEIHISRTYDLTTPNGGLQLVAKGDLNLDYIGSDGKKLTRYGVPEAGAKGAFTKILSGLLSEKLPREENDGFELPGNWKKAGKLKARHAQAENGWLLLGLEQEGAESEQNVAQDVTQPTLEQTAIVVGP